MKLLSLFSALLFVTVNLVFAQQGGPQRIPVIGSRAPSFKAPSTNGTISFPKDFPGKWKILFAHPRDFTPVCSSELLELAYRQEEFNNLDAQIVILSVDRMVSHLSWKNDLENVMYKDRNKIKINFPLVVDSSASISFRYGMVDPQHNYEQTIRGVFFIDPQDVIRAYLFYPNAVGRNIDEILRTLKALQTHDAHPEIVIPANWQPGDDYMIPFLRPEDKQQLKEADSSIYYINWYMIFKKAP